MAGSPTAAWLPKRPEQAPAHVSGPRFARLGRAHTPGRATRPFRFGSEDRPDPDPALGVGSLIGDRYQIRRLLGEGGMGRVYEAQHTVLQRRVALKLLRRDAAAEPENLARFRQEALAASRIGAPEIVEVVDFASHTVAGGQQTYMVMELLAGQSLEDWMDGNARLDAGLEVLASLCDGLAAAHRAAVVHRDIKPANVFLPARNPTLPAQVRVKILDFGIAKITAGGEGFQTRQGSLLGTPYYLAPERVMGAELTGAADVYSVGVILYEMLTGNVPFVADSFMGILANHVHTAPLDPRQAAPDRPIPGEVAQLCLRLLSKDPQARPSAEAVAVTLRGLLSRDPVGIAAVEIGPRGIAGSGADTQIIATGTHALALADRPTQAPLASPESSRSSTQIGHAAAAGTQAMVLPPSVVVAAPVEPSKPAGTGIGRGVGIGLAASLGAAVIAVALWLGLRDDRTAPNPDAQTEAAASRDVPSEAEQPVVDPPVTEAEAGPAARLAGGDDPSGHGNTDSEATLVAAPPEPAPKPESQTKRRSGSKTRKRDEPKPDPEPKPEPEPITTDPPQQDPPAPEPANPDLPTIKDDVYD